MTELELATSAFVPTAELTGRPLQNTSALETNDSEQRFHIHSTVCIDIGGEKGAFPESLVESRPIHDNSTYSYDINEY